MTGFAPHGNGPSHGAPHANGPMKLEDWNEGLSASCLAFQVDLSCLVDGELDEAAASRAVAHLEHCPSCTDFFEDARLQLRLHLDMADPDSLVERYAHLTGQVLEDEIEALELVHRLSSIFYHLGKAYVLSAIDPDFRTRVFEPAVQVAVTRTHGRGFIDGVVSSGRGSAGGVDWTDMRHLLNGKLSRIEGALEKGSRLLREALAVEPDHEEARIYLAFVDVHEGRRLKAARAFQEIFDDAIDPVNRGHAAIQLSKLHAAEGDWRRAIVYTRWTVQSGLASREARFWVVHFNLASYYAKSGRSDRSVAAFRRLLDLHPDKCREVASDMIRRPQLRAAIESQPGFAESLFRTCPELFEPADDDRPAGDPASTSTDGEGSR